MTMQTVVELPRFSLRAKSVMTEAELDEAKVMIATDPECGDPLEGTGGVRKVRFAVGNKGKSGGVRIVYYFYNEAIPVFLLTVFAKKDMPNLKKAERNELAKLTAKLRESYGAK
jgi:hypothetical protein